MPEEKDSDFTSTGGINTTPGVSNILNGGFPGSATGYITNPATGAIARTATNIRSGARTPIAGIVHAFTLLLSCIVFVLAMLRIFKVSLAEIAR